MKFLFTFLLPAILIVAPASTHNDYKVLECQGEIPPLFTNGVKEYIKLQEDLLQDYFNNDEKLDELKEKLILGSAFNHDFYFRSGLILFGDPITIYLNKIKTEILKNRADLKDKINIYTLKSSEVNALSTLDGNIYVTLGLIARAESEAELAFVLSHEIAHYTSHHTLEQLKTAKELEDLTNARKKLTLDDILRYKLRRSREHELEADSIGFLMYNESAYKSEEPLALLSNLALAHKPIGDTPFDKNYFNKEFFCVPTCFYKDETKKLEARENKNDQLLTHPDIDKRKKRVSGLILKTKAHGSKFVIQKTEFDSVKKLAMYEVVQRLLINRNFGDAIFTSYYLLQKDPDNEFLHLAIVKGLYYSAIYKNQQALHYTAASYSNREGESQQLYYLLKQLSGVQLNTLALREVSKLKEKFVTNRSLDLMETRLIEDLVMKHNITAEKFYSKQESEKQFRERFGVPISDTISDKIKLRQDYKNFYLLGLYHLKEDPKILAKFSLAKEKKTKEDATQELSYKERLKIDAEEKRYKEKFGEGIKANDIVVFEPEYFKFEKEVAKSYDVSQNEKRMLVEELQKQVKQFNKNITFKTTMYLTAKDTPLYNDYCVLAGWLQEREGHINGIKTIPSMGDIYNNNRSLSEKKFICSLSIVEISNSRLLYVFALYNAATGECVYTNHKIEKDSLKLQKLVAFIIKDFEKVIN